VRHTARVPKLRIAQDAAADELLGRDPLALLIGMLLDQQFPMERAFGAPRLLADRLGVDGLDAARLAAVDADELTRVFQGPPALHRYPGSMAGRAQDPAADELLGRDPLALLIGMLLDQQFPMERAFGAPRLLAERLGVESLDAARLAEMDAEELTRIFQGPPALHRYPGSMAGRTQELCRLLVERYEGRAENLWADAPDGATPHCLPSRARKIFAFCAPKPGSSPSRRSRVAPSGASDHTASARPS